jgi:hypothetical protein
MQSAAPVNLHMARISQKSVDVSGRIKLIVLPSTSELRLLRSKSNGALCNLCTSASTNGWHCYFPFAPVVLLLLSMFHSFPPCLFSFILYYLKFGVGLTYFPNAFIRYVDGLAVLSFQIKISEQEQSDSHNCVTGGPYSFTAVHISQRNVTRKEIRICCREAYHATVATT